MPEQGFKGYVNSAGEWHIEGTPGSIVVKEGEIWVAEVTTDHHGEWTVSHRPERKAPDPPPEFVKMYDSTNPKALLRFAADDRNIMIAYDDGTFKDVTEAHALFPNHSIFTVGVRFGDKCNFADTEPGNMSHAQAISMWIEQECDGIYSDKSEWETMLRVVQSHEKALNRHCIKWVADPNPNNVPHIPVWADICQYGFDGTYDVSLARFQKIAHLL